MYSETVRYYLSIVGCAFSLPIGFFGNIISIIIFNNKVFKKQSGTLYFKLDCIINIIILLQLPHQLMLTFWINLQDLCRLSFGIMLVTSEVQAWISVLCSVDRLIGVLTPYKFNFRKNGKFQFRLISIIGFFNNHY